MADDTPTTELVDLDATRLDGVQSPANGTPWLLIKAAAPDDETEAVKADTDDDGDEKPCETCGGKGTIRDGHVDCPDCDGPAKKAEADDIEEELTGEAEKAKLDAADRKEIPAGKFAYVDSKGDKHLPIHDEEHVRAALGRFNQTDFESAEAKEKAAGKIKAAAAEHGIDVSDDSHVAQAAKGQVQEALNGCDTPEANGTIPSGTSGLAGPVTAGPADMPNVLAQDGRGPSSSTGLVTRVDGGESTYRIPAESKINGPAVKHAAIAFTASSLAQAIEQIDEIRHSDQAVKADASVPGSAPWESYDAATLSQVAGMLAQCAAAIDAIQKRETVEAVSGDPGDWCDAWDLQEAQMALDCALGIAARLAYVEQAAAQASKEIDLERLQAAQDTLTRTLSAGEHAIKAHSATAEGSTLSEEDIMAVEVTKEELAEAIVAGTNSAVEALKSELVAEIAEAVKNANNGGDITAADIKPTGQIEEDLDGVGGHVDPEYVNKSIAEQLGEVVKAAVAAETEPLKELVAKMARRPRAGGPILDGQIRPDLARQDVAKSADGEIEQLEKALSEATDPGARQHLAERLFVAKAKAQATDQFGHTSPFAPRGL